MKKFLLAGLFAAGIAVFINGCCCGAGKRDTVKSETYTKKTIKTQQPVIE